MLESYTSENQSHISQNPIGQTISVLMNCTVNVCKKENILLTDWHMVYTFIFQVV